MPPIPDTESPIPSTIGAIFDWDGVIVDSHDQHEKSWILLAGELGVSLTRAQFKESFGMRNEHIIPHVFRWADPADTGRIRALGDRKEELYRELIRTSGIEPLPGVRDLLAALHESGIPCAVGSSTPRENIDCVLQIIGLAGRFASVIAAADVTRGKPDPEVFLLAAQRIHRAPENCVVFEDAHVGLEAARAGGMRTIAVTTTHPAATLRDAADIVVDSLEEVEPDTIAALFPGPA